MNDKFKLAIIYGMNNEKKEIYDGKIEFYGDITTDASHIKTILAPSIEKYPEMKIFSQLNYLYSPEIPAYFHTKLGNIVLFDFTKYHDGVARYGHNCLLLMPNLITDKQKETLLNLARDLENYYMIISYDLKLVDGIIESQDLVSKNLEKPVQLLERYFKILYSEHHK